MRILRTLQIGAHAAPELTQHEGHERRAAIHQPQHEEHSVLHPANAPDAQMHFAPLAVQTRVHIVFVEVTAHAELYHHDP